MTTTRDPSTNKGNKAVELLWFSKHNNFSTEVNWITHAKTISCKGNHTLTEISRNWLKHGCYRSEYSCDGFSEHLFFIHRYIKLLRLPLGHLEESSTNHHELADGVTCSVGHINRRSFTACLPHRAIFDCNRLLSERNFTLRCCKPMCCHIRSICCSDQAIGIPVSSS